MIADHWKEELVKRRALLIPPLLRRCIVVKRRDNRKETQMAIEQMNISLPPGMARFIRGKVKAGEYIDASEVVRDAVRHMQEAEAFKNERQGASKEDLDEQLTTEERESVLTSVQKGVKDLEEGRYEEFGEEGLKQYFAGIVQRGTKRLTAASSKRQA